VKLRLQGEACQNEKETLDPKPERSSGKFSLQGQDWHCCSVVALEGPAFFGKHPNVKQKKGGGRRSKTAISQAIAWEKRRRVSQPAGEQDLLWGTCGKVAGGEEDGLRGL